MVDFTDARRSTVTLRWLTVAGVLTQIATSTTVAAGKALVPAISLGVIAPMWLLVAYLTLTLRRQLGHRRGWWLAAVFAGLAAAIAIAAELLSRPRYGSLACEVAGLGWIIATSLRLSLTTTQLAGKTFTWRALSWSTILVVLAGAAALTIWVIGDGLRHVTGMFAAQFLYRLVVCQRALARQLARRDPMPTATAVAARP